VSDRSGPVGVGVIGAGTISGAYLRNLNSFPDVRVHAIGDLVPAVAAARAAEFGVPRSGSPAEVLGHDDVEIVVNLTIPAAHAEISIRALESGRHVWTEKPLALDPDSGHQVVTTAASAGVRLGCAPDTVLGAGIQTALRVIAAGDIGRPLAGLTLFQTAGPESWHPNPGFYFLPGGGPLFDMGPYYLTTLVQALGPITRVAAVGSRSRLSRVVGSGPLAGTPIPVEVDTHLAMLAQFAGGGTSQSVFSFESPLPRGGFVEITGTEATLSLPDPNNFDGDLRIRRTGSDDWESIPLAGAVAGRGLGVLDMARSIRAGVSHRITGELGEHVLEAMAASVESATRSEFVDLDTTVEPFAPLPADWDPYARTL
jgi:predicted dehydrogenase